MSALNNDVLPAPDGPRIAITVFSRCTNDMSDSKTFAGSPRLAVLARTPERMSLMSPSRVARSAVQPSKTRYRRSANSKWSPGRSSASLTTSPNMYGPFP